MTLPLHKILRKIKKQINLALEIIKEGVDANAKSDCGETLLDLAIRTDVASIIELLIVKGADVNIKNKHGATPLQAAAAFSENLHIFKLLIDAGADVNAKSYLHGNSLHYAVLTNKSVDVCKFLIDAGVEVNAKNNDDETPLHQAVKSSNVDAEVLKLLIKSGADVQAEDADGNTALNLALYSSGFENLNVLNLLLEAGADVNKKNKSGYSPLRDFLFHENVDIDGFKFFLKAGYNVNDDDKNGKTCLTVLIKKVMRETNDRVRELTQKSIEFLIEYCDINHTDEIKRNILANVLNKNSESAKKEYFYKIILKHVAKLKSLKLNIDSRLLRTIEACNDYRRYFTQCTQELENAKVTKLDKSSISVFNFLVDCEIKLINYSENQYLIKDFKKRVTNFPTYQTEMQNNLLKAIEDRKVYNKATITLSKCCPIFDSNHLVIKGVLNVLDLQDWMKLNVKTHLV